MILRISTFNGQASLEVRPHCHHFKPRPRPTYMDLKLAMQDNKKLIGSSSHTLLAVIMEEDAWITGTSVVADNKDDQIVR